MINSLFMLGSSYNKSKIMSNIFMVAWVAYMLVGSNLSLGITFPVVNAIAFLVVTFCINRIKNRCWNTVLSIFSILVWSVVIDTICFYMYPAFTGSLSVFQYIYQGLLFNARYVISNVIAVVAINAIIFISNKIKILTKAENC
ncbi:MAG: hypothetical protein IJO08_01405 [Clostridia bacterium]|nr:hypothetical protein [Clostridia bacterium]